MKTTLVIMLLATSSLFAATKQSHKMMPMEMTAEQRVKMATAHENMAACLKSDKNLETCHSEMMGSCKSIMGEDSCDMGMGMGKMQHDKMMNR
jgi:curli biogenesis system outer membrane secretion channel CsgG